MKAHAQIEAYDVPLTLGDKNPIISVMEFGFGMGDVEFSALDINKIDGLIIRAVGAGTLSHPTRDYLKTITDKIPVVFVSRTDAGEIFTNYYNTKGTGGDLIECGLISGGFLNSRQARMLLIAGLSNPSNNIQNIFCVFQ